MLKAPETWPQWKELLQEAEKHEQEESYWIGETFPPSKMHLRNNNLALQTYPHPLIGMQIDSVGRVVDYSGTWIRRHQPELIAPMDEHSFSSGIDSAHYAANFTHLTAPDPQIDPQLYVCQYSGNYDSLITIKMAILSKG